MSIYTIIGLCGIWHILGLALLCVFCVEEDFYGNEKLELENLNPKCIHKRFRVNWFGVICLALVINLLCPIASILYWFYKLCTVGRKK